VVSLRFVSCKKVVCYVYEYINVLLSLPITYIPFPISMYLWDVTCAWHTSVVDLTMELTQKNLHDAGEMMRTIQNNNSTFLVNLKRCTFVEECETTRISEECETLRIVENARVVEVARVAAELAENVKKIEAVEHVRNVELAENAKKLETAENARKIECLRLATLAHVSGPYCAICRSQPNDVLFIPCKHLSCCADCATHIMTTTKICPICRGGIACWFRCFNAGV
jgi:hypothetical protein